MKLQTVYKQTKSNKVQEWTIEVEQNKYRTTSGQIDGKKTTSEWTMVEGKNLGRANQTTAEEQALKEAIAKRDKQIEQGYVEDLADAAVKKFYEPMLAQKWEDRKDEIAYPIYSNPKLDGCLSYSTEILTDRGTLQLGDIVESGIDCRVMSYNTHTRKAEFKPVLGRAKNGVDLQDSSEAQWFEVVLEDETVLQITGNHRVYIPILKCWRRVDELQQGDSMLKLTI